MDEVTLLRKIDETCAGVGLKAYLEGLVWPVSVAGVKARVSTIQSPMVNAVGMATFTEENVDEGIRNVIDQYRREGKMFGWYVGPTSRPADLGERLVAAGLTRIEEQAAWGMVLRDLNHAIVANPDVRVERVSIAEWDAHVSIMMRAYGFGMTEEATSMMCRFYESLGQNAQAYLAYVPDRKEPVAFSGSVFDDERSVVTLGGAGTLEEYRGRGIYSAMVAKRLEDAQAMGITTAIIQAAKGTSAPICAKLGFEIVCPIDLYVHM